MTEALKCSYRLFRRDGKRTPREGVALYVAEQLEHMKLCLGTGEEPMGSLWIRFKGRTGKGDIIMGACCGPLDQEEQVDEAL